MIVFSIGANPAQPGPQQVDRHLVLEQLLAVHRHHGDPHPVAAGQLRVAVDVDQLQVERGAAARSSRRTRSASSQRWQPTLV